MDKPKPLRLYAVAPAEAGFQLCLNTAPFRSPAGHPFVVPTRNLAEAIADEWRAQGDKPKPETMPLTQLAATALDIVAAKKDEIVASVAAYAASDLLCHHAEAPPELVERQAKIWQPWLDWCKATYGVRLRAGQGVMPVVQPKETLAILRSDIAACGPFHLAGLQQAVSVTGSLVLGLALAKGDATLDVLFEAAELDSLFQMEMWGEDPVTTARLANVKRELADCVTWFRLLSKEA